MTVLWIQWGGVEPDIKKPEKYTLVFFRLFGFLNQAGKRVFIFILLRNAYSVYAALLAVLTSTGTPVLRAILSSLRCTLRILLAAIL